MERSVWDRIEKARKDAMNDGNPAAFSRQSWITFLALNGLNVYRTTGKSVDLKDILKVERQ